jgi:pimeloyl-ACP methyl ester carboxylesterase
MKGRIRAALAGASLAGGLGLGLVPSAPVTAGTCTGDPNAILSLQTEMGISGRYALPASAPSALVIFGHGYRNDSSSWEGHLTEAANHGIAAVAPDYTGLGPAPDFRGWPAAAGAADLVAAGEHFYSLCSPSVKRVIIMGVSMGGNMTGLAVAAQAKRPNGKLRPHALFDYWIDVEGVTNLLETWAEATAVAPANPYAAGAEADIEAETGGTPVTALQAYLDRDVVVRHTDVANAEPSGVVMIHSVEDGLVPYDQTREMTQLLRFDCKRVDVYSVLRRTADRDPGHDQTTLLSDVNSTLGDMDPFSGHAWEGSSTHIVMVTAMDRLFDLAGNTNLPDNREFLVDSGLGTVKPLPDLPDVTQNGPACKVTTNPVAGINPQIKVPGVTSAPAAASVAPAVRHARVSGPRAL